MATWTNELVKNSNGEVHVKFTSSLGQVFIKRYKEEYSDTFLSDKLSFIEGKQTTFETIKSMLNIDFPIREGWSFKFNYAHMPSDFIEIFVEVTTPWQKFNKMFNVTTVDGAKGLSDYIENEKLKINTMIDAIDLEGLGNYFGEEVTLDGSYIE